MLSCQVALFALMSHESQAEHIMHLRTYVAIKTQATLCKQYTHVKKGASSVNYETFIILKLLELTK